MSKVALSNASKWKEGIIVLISGTAVFLGGMTATGQPRFYRNVLMPIGQKLFDAETAHQWTIKLAKWRALPYIKPLDSSVLKSRVWNLDFDNPVGLAAGFDKQGEAVDGLLKLGFGFVEVGSVTPEPQPGNAKPRVFRLPEDGAVINRYGFNSDGHTVVLERLTSRGTDTRSPGVVGVNLGKNASSADAVGDYVSGVRAFGDIADYLVVNVSSPNTPGLRAMQRREALLALVAAATDARDRLARSPRPPLLVKVAPDLTREEKVDVAAVVSRPGSGVDGIVVSNTTISRPAGLKSEHAAETGGLSGAPLKSLATETIRDFYALTSGAVPIIGVGGVASGRDAYEKIKAGASLVQLYTAFVYHGPPIARTVNEELEKLLVADGYKSVSEAVGADHKSV
ncbi:PREDICTED: dihydroorotate dehydrogenase (quinone), mitochondrial-like [Priapulus caudatus]|uniref:Dihydroorotate dehydrogenase (quinone), mitochondrial n=1 Tax=Priapulus caudatus TaxID=37621 RepID=A0ABM1DRQ0_PRICU|nr:PREDICTED: dihydroorotate dehydrogenase (quinone), mitochondrial-like [Priapulus caudatus]